MVQKMETSRSEVVLELELPSIADRGTSRGCLCGAWCYVNSRNDVKAPNRADCLRGVESIRETTWGLTSLLLQTLFGLCAGTTKHSGK